jgi:RNA polymerase sigma-54 factor
MSHAGLTQRGELRQTLKLAPQMQQSLQILQAATLELRALVQQELVENPVLEDETVEVSLEDRDLREDDDDGFGEEFSRLSRMDDEWRDYLSQSRQSVPRTAEDEERRQFVLDSLVRPESLQEFLLGQLNTEGVEDGVRGLAELVIGNLDENGFLHTSPDDLCLIHRLRMEDLQRALSLVQSFDPPGVGATGLADCLLIQLRRAGRERGLEYRIVAQHLDDLAHRRYPQIARKLGVTTEQVAEAASSIAMLDPKPGRHFESGSNHYVTPDVFVEPGEAGGFTVRLNQEQVPRLRISSAYKELMATQGDRREVRDYIKEKIRSGRSLIESIAQRQETIRLIAEEIVKRQEGFLREGRSGLKPMTMAQVADVVGVHETTVSRAIAGKYMATPQGVFDLKFFFTTGYRTESGEDVANTSVKAAIAELVAAENPKKPLSDQVIVAKLAERGITIARRTVAKYREELEILPSHLRKGY